MAILVSNHSPTCDCWKCWDEETAPGLPDHLSDVSPPEQTGPPESETTDARS